MNKISDMESELVTRGFLPKPKSKKKKPVKNIKKSKRSVVQFAISSCICRWLPSKLPIHSLIYPAAEWFDRAEGVLRTP